MSQRMGWIALSATLLLSGCMAEVVRKPVSFSSQAMPAERVLSTTAVIQLDSGYERTLPAQTRLLEVGAIPDGTVLKPMNALLTVEGAHVHEAYAVVKSDMLVGFYLPVEKAFSPLSKPVKLNFSF